MISKINVRMCGGNSLKMTGMTMAWTFVALGLSANLAKSAMFRPKVA